ncbi:MAG: hypothetical protein HAW67_02100, partial [Endozoicomonadaceae bacterium]|nr:hypothetical protein [Endozoicomonadaceae bacterium]
MVKWINQAADGVTFDLKGFSSTTKIPAYILMHLDTLKLLPKEVLTKTLLERSLTTDNTPKLPRLLKIVLTLWEQASDSQVHPTGVVSFSFGSGGWTPYDVNKYLKNFLETDPSGAVAAIYLEQSIKDLQSYLESKIISDTQLVALGKLQWIFEQTSYIEFKQDQISQLINKVRPFKAELSTSEIGFIEQLPIFEIEHSTRSFNHYKKLNVCTGEVATQSPVFSKLIFEVASVEELVTKMKHLPTGFALCLVKNSNPADSYFAIAVKNGGNLTILSDVPSYAHPLQEQMMAARNNRYNMERHCEYLPYELMNLTWEDKGRTCTDESTSKSIIDPSTDIKILGNFNQLSIKQMLWIGHFFELCYERYFISNVVEPTLSLISK